ncbi:hypothetical protein GQ44DRAFT_612234 [Phaeosphaeriaceae sp. PMI808]|nr:hypothetical protein GQ44DRAFT_612234 [Phaeosphaeriaceae sp. PMI808]
MLGKCAFHLASCSSRVECTLYSQSRSISSHVRTSIGDALGSTRSDGHQTFRTRKNGDAKELPLPPLLDPLILEKRARWENSKAQPDFENLTPFQQKLLATPYAHALASPVRQCRATLILLPVAFLTTLHARPHPTTDDPWLLPISLTTDKAHLGPPYPFIGRHAVTTQLGKKKLWERGLYARFEEKYGSKNVKRMVWREDLPDLIVDLMQKQLVKKLSWNFSFRGRLIPVASPGSSDIEDKDDISCVLIFGSLRTHADNIQTRANAIIAEVGKWSSYVTKTFVDKLDPHASPHVTHSSPTWYTEPLVPRLQPRFQYPELEFKSTMWRGRKVPLYSLTDLLGEEKARQLIKGSKYEEATCVLMKKGRHNVAVEILLMRLQAYIAQPGP